MIIESILVVFFALVLDFTVGDPRNKFHPTAWIGSLIAKLTPHTKNASKNLEKLGGVFIILISTGIVAYRLHVHYNFSNSRQHITKVNHCN